MSTAVATSKHMATGSQAIRPTKTKSDHRLHLSTAWMWAIAAVVTAFAFMLSFTLAWGDRMDRLDAMASSDVFADKTYATIDGGQYSTDSLKDTRLTAFNVWSTTCPPCIKEMPALEELNNAYPDSEFRVVGILYDSASSDGTVSQKHVDEGIEIASSAGVTYPNLVVSAELYAFITSSVVGTPTTYFVDSEGTVVETVTGGKELDAWKTKVDEVLAGLN